MNSIPLIKGNTPQEINTSIIALKKALDNLQATNSEDLQKRIDEINAQIETLNQHLNTIDGQITDLQPVDTVTSGNMHSVTSNAVAAQLYNLKIKPFSFNIQSVTKDQEYIITFTDMNIGNINVNAFALEFIGGNNAFDYEGCLYCRNTRKQFLYKCGYTQNNLRAYGIVFYTD